MTVLKQHRQARPSKRGVPQCVKSSSTHYHNCLRSSNRSKGEFRGRGGKLQDTTHSTLNRVLSTLNRECKKLRSSPFANLLKDQSDGLGGLLSGIAALSGFVWILPEQPSRASDFPEEPSQGPARFPQENKRNFWVSIK